MAENLLKLNEAKTEYILLGSKYSLEKLTNIQTVEIGDDIIHATSSVKNIGASIDGKLTMVPHINNICKSCYLHLRHLSQIRNYLTKDVPVTLVHAFISSKLDNLNSLLYGLPEYMIEKLQLIQNHAARLVMKKKKYDNVTPLLYELHWLPVKYRIQYKILLLVYKCLNNLAPSYLISLLQEYSPTRCLRSGDKFLLAEPVYRTESHGRRAFSVCAPRLWNKLPKDIRQSDTVWIFKSVLKTHLFKKAYPE